MRYAPFLILASTLACGNPGPSATTTAQDEIRGGRAELGYPEVGALRGADGRHVCTGTLIAPSYVLTAAHCFDFFTGPTDFVAGERVRTISDHFVHPSYGRRTTPTSPVVGLDVAVVRLSEAMAGGAAARLSNLDEVSGRNDLYVRSVGFGLDDAETVGTKRSAVEWITRIEPQTFTTRGISGSTHSGDSGGPVYLGGSVVGTTSSGFGLSISMSVGAARPWLDETTDGGITWVPAEAKPDPDAPREVCERAASRLCSRSEEDAAPRSARERSACIESYSDCGEPPAFAYCLVAANTCDDRAVCSMLPKSLCLSTSPPASWPSAVREAACDEYAGAREACAGAESRSKLLADCARRFDDCRGRVPESVRCVLRDGDACSPECLARSHCL